MPDVKLDGNGSKPMMGPTASVSSSVTKKMMTTSSAPRPPKPGMGPAPTATRTKQPKPGMGPSPSGGIKKGGGPVTTGIATEVHGFLSHDSAENKEGGMCHCATGYEHGMKSCHGIGPVTASGMEGGSHGSSGKKC